jgi:hypothetical protein
MSDTSQGPGWWLASDEKRYSPESKPQPEAPPPALRQATVPRYPPTASRTTALKKKGNRHEKEINRKRIGILVIGIILLIVIDALAAGGGGSGGSVTPEVQSVKPFDSNEVRISINWVNSGSSPASASCVITTTVHNQSGDLVEVPVNPTDTDGNVPAHSSQLLYQYIGVGIGDAQFVTTSDVFIGTCQVCAVMDSTQAGHQSAGGTSEDTCRSGTASRPTQ